MCICSEQIGYLSLILHLLFQIICPSPLLQNCFHLNESSFPGESHFWDKSPDLCTSLCCGRPKLSPSLARSCESTRECKVPPPPSSWLSSWKYWGSEQLSDSKSVLRLVTELGENCISCLLLHNPLTSDDTSFTQVSSFKQVKPKQTRFQFLCQPWMITSDTPFKRYCGGILSGPIVTVVMGQRGGGTRGLFCSSLLTYLQRGLIPFPWENPATGKKHQFLDTRSQSLPESWVP